MEDREIRDRLKEKFQEKYNKNGRLFFAPSRINLIGEHIDYNGGKVMPCAIDIGTYAMAEKNEQNKLRLYSINMGNGLEIPLDRLDYDRKYDWANYVAGMVKFLGESGYKIGGLDILIYGNIPYGAGLSSSASLEMLIGKIVNSIYNFDMIPSLEIVKLGQKVENDHFGLNSGIMDQFACNMGKENSFILLDTSSLDYQYIDAKLEDNIVILNTNKSRELKDSKYNERFSECKEALKILQEFEDIDNLCQIRDIELLDKIQDKTLRKRARHVVEENLRVYDMIEAIRDKDYERMGQILDLSHKSLKDNYEVTGKYLDAIVEAAQNCEHTLGARMTGAGFAGCAIAIVKKDGTDNFVDRVTKEYKEKTGLEPSFIFANIAGSPREVKV